MKAWYPDSAKLFSTYALHLNWFEQHPSGYIDEASSKLKKLINNRIKWNLDQNGFRTSKDPWSVLIAPDVLDNPSDSSFVHVLERTMCTPRDFILLFKPLPDLRLPLPIDRDNLNKLLIRYSIDKVAELKNELAFWFEPETVDSIFDALNKVLLRGAPKRYRAFFNSSDIVPLLEDRVVSHPPDFVLERLFDYSIIGNFPHGSSHPYFKHREPAGEKYTFQIDQQMVLHRAVEMCFTQNAT